MRRARATVRQTAEDPVYRHKLVTKLINCSMRDGKRSVAQRHVYSAFEVVKAESGQEPLHVFLSAVENIKPTMEVRPRRIGGAAYQVPVPVRGSRRESLAIKWLMTAANARSAAQYKTYGAKLAAEILDASQNQGGAVGKRAEVERVAEANRAFAHFRW